MKTCFQFENMTILQHGESVAAWFRDLYGYYHGQALEREWRLPSWIDCPLIKAKLLDFHLTQTYQIYHDCGKPLCMTYDEQGRKHFPNHAAISSQCFLDHSDGSEIAAQIARLIAMDMDIHTLKSDGLDEFAKRPEAITLLVTGLCEIHSNALMFGGIESTSFKIKWKQIDKMGKRILERMRTDSQ